MISRHAHQVLQAQNKHTANLLLIHPLSSLTRDAFTVHYTLLSYLHRALAPGRDSRCLAAWRWKGGFRCELPRLATLCVILQQPRFFHRLNLAAPFLRMWGCDSREHIRLRIPRVQHLAERGTFRCAWNAFARKLSQIQDDCSSFGGERTSRCE